jgi:hypothetical protein
VLAKKCKYIGVCDKKWRIWINNSYSFFMFTHLRKFTFDIFT